MVRVFPAGTFLENLVPSYPKAAPGWFNIGLLHTSATGYEGHDRYAPCTLDDLRAKQYDYWALGHIHKRGVLCEDPPVIFPATCRGDTSARAVPKVARWSRSTTIAACRLSRSGSMCSVGNRAA